MDDFTTIDDEGTEETIMLSPEEEREMREWEKRQDEKWQKEQEKFDKTCCKCGHKWRAKVPNPVKCPRCDSRKWSGI